MKDMMIRVKHRCGTCEKGIVQNPIWAQFYNEYPEVLEPGCTEKYFDEAAFKFCPEGIHDEPEEIPCDECEGIGWVEEWRDAYEVARELRRLAQTDEEYLRTT